MKNKILGQTFLPLVTILLLALPCGSCYSAVEGGQTQEAPSARPLPENARVPGQIERDVAVRAAENELSPQARETYAYLLYLQAVLDEDEAAFLDVAPLLAAGNVPPSVWLDGGIWLMSRKSPNAIVFLEQALKALPENLSLNLLYAESLGDHGMAERGVEVMRDYLKRHPDELDARLELSLLLVKDKQFTEAEKILAEITPKQRTPLVDYYQAKALVGMDRRQEAIPYLRKAIKGLPDFVEAMAELAFIYEREGNWREARSTYEKLQKMQFSPQDVSLRLINLSLKLKQPDKAVQYVRKGPDTLPFKLAAANMLMESRHFLQAESILKQLVERDDAPVEVYLLLADLVYEQRRNLNMALAWLDRIPPEKPGQDKATILRVQLMAEAGKIADALKLADESLRDHPSLPELLDLRIRLLAREKKLDAALDAAREAAQKWPDNMGFSFLLGSLLDETGHKKEALEVMEDIVKKQPDNYQALNYVGFSLAEENRDLERALKLLTRADELSPNQAYIVDSLAWAHYRAGQVEEALRLIRRAVSLGDPMDAAIWEHYGDIAVSLGKKDEARKAYRKAIELKPDNVKDIKGRLSRI